MERGEKGLIEKAESVNSSSASPGRYWRRAASKKLIKLNDMLLLLLIRGFLNP